MFHLFLKTLRDKRYFILGWTLGLAFLGFAMTSFYPSFNGGQIDELLKSMPPALQGLVGDAQDWRELPGYLGSQIFDVRLSIIIGILAILLAIGLTVAEEDKGQLRTLVSLPLSRRKVIAAKWSAMVLICGIASFATVLGVVAGLVSIGESVDATMLLRLGLFTWLVVASLATIIFAIGLSTGKRAVTTALAVVFTVGGYLLTTFAQAVEWLEPYSPLSFFHYFPATDIAKGTIDWMNVTFYGVCIVLALVVTWVFFPRRDIKA